MKSLHPVPRSPDLTPLDYFFFGHLKNTIFKTLIHTIEELKDRITEKCVRMTPATLQKMKHEKTGQFMYAEVIFFH